MRSPRCTFARRASKLLSTTQHSDVNAMSEELYLIRRAQLIHSPRALKLLGPIGLLPTEILSNIFLHCVSKFNDAGDLSNAPLVLTQVCSSWRKVCLRIPQLWTNLNLSLAMVPTLPQSSPFIPATLRPTTASPPFSPAKTPQALANLASLWLKRAQTQLLSVSINFTSTHTSRPADISSVLEPILSNAHSIQRLSIHVTCASQLREFFSSSQDDAAFINLESLSLSIQHVDISTPITTFCNTPRLTRVLLDLNRCPPSTSLIHLPWASIEQFEMTGASILPADAFQALLASCSNLREASFWVEDSLQSSRSSVSNTGASNTIITLPKLSHLFISFYGRQTKTASSLLTGFYLPHLRHFHFFSGFVTLPCLPSITSNHLETLVASGTNVPAAEFLSFATENPSLRSLTFDLRYFGSEDIKNILNVLAAEKPRVLPALANLSLWTQDISPHSSAYLRMIESRSRNSPSTGLRFSLNLARQQHGTCCHFSTCATPSMGGTRLDEILTLADACEKAGGVDFYLKDVKPDEGIHEFA